MSLKQLSDAVKAGIITPQDAYDAMTGNLDEELDKLVKALGVGRKDIAVNVDGNKVDIDVKLPIGIDFIPIEIDLNNIQIADCSHEWTEYHGLQESFKFCKKCDKKQ